VSSEIVIDCSC